MSDHVQARSPEAAASTAAEAERIEPRERSEHERWMDEMAADARADVDELFATRALRFGRDRELGPVLFATRAELDDRKRRRSMTIGDLAVTLCAARADLDFEHEHEHEHEHEYEYEYEHEYEYDYG